MHYFLWKFYKQWMNKWMCNMARQTILDSNQRCHYKLYIMQHYNNCKNVWKFIHCLYWILRFKNLYKDISIINRRYCEKKNNMKKRHFYKQMFKQWTLFSFSNLKLCFLLVCKCACFFFRVILFSVKLIL
jgi:hypothetical protein